MVRLYRFGSTLLGSISLAAALMALAASSGSAEAAVQPVGCGCPNGNFFACGGDCPAGKTCLNANCFPGVNQNPLCAQNICAAAP